MKTEELKKILENHKHWLNKDCEGWENMRADLHGADLRGANLIGAELYGANMYGANLYGANMYGANLYEADLRYTNMHGANMHRANLYEADLRYTNMHGANLYEADLRYTNMHGANMYGANLYEADLRYTNMHGAKNAPAFPYACPDTGSFIGWKKASGKIICLEIPADAKRSSATGRKCRCNKAKVISITELDGNPCELTEVMSSYDERFVYRVGEMVSVDNFDEDRWRECAPGIHFFINRMEAVAY